jgi:asparagine synthase (glutamine-hydrolysing)
MRVHTLEIGKNLMCGITGGIGPQAPNLQLIENQLFSMQHRGPDGTGTYVSKGIGLGMCRLAIVEVVAGTQPASDESGTVRIVWNGEIYNYKELRSKLLAAGIKCRDSSESEVLLKLYLEYGLKFVNHLNGMFAIAIFDYRTNSLHLIRDRMGKKPIWIINSSDGTLFFASEIRALKLTGQRLTLRPEMIEEVMQFGYINIPKSAFNEIQQIPPAAITSWVNGTISTQTYWTHNFYPKIEMSYREALENTKKVIEEAVVRRLVSERPIGSFLSGGYDSTIVTAFMVKHMAKTVDTFSIGFENENFNEAPFAKKIAEFLGTNHHEEIVSPDPNIVVEKIAGILDLPFADSSIVPTYILANFARSNLTVALGGDGGDEIFGGYDRYLANLLLQKIGPIVRMGSPTIQFVAKATNSKRLGSRQITPSLLKNKSLSSRYMHLMSLAKQDDLSRIFNPELLSLNSKTTFNNLFENKNLTSLDKMINYDIRSYLPGDLLVKADIASMSNSLELRSPMLDVNVVEWGLSLPDNFRIKGFETKRILKDVARSLVSAELIDRPKMGFAIPRAEWLRTDMKNMMIDLLTDQTASNRGWFKPEEVKKVIKSHVDGKDEDKIIWPMLMLELWARNWLDKD